LVAELAISLRILHNVTVAEFIANWAERSG
jgi:hypothetical protein